MNGTAVWRICTISKIAIYVHPHMVLYYSSYSFVLVYTNGSSYNNQYTHNIHHAGIYGMARVIVLELLYTLALRYIRDQAAGGFASLFKFRIRYYIFFMFIRSLGTIQFRTRSAILLGPLFFFLIRFSVK